MHLMLLPKCLYTHKWWILHEVLKNLYQQRMWAQVGTIMTYRKILAPTKCNSEVDSTLHQRDLITSSALRNYIKIKID